MRIYFRDVFFISFKYFRMVVFNFQRDGLIVGNWFRYFLRFQKERRKREVVKKGRMGDKGEEWREGEGGRKKEGGKGREIDQKEEEKRDFILWVRQRVV